MKMTQIFVELATVEKHMAMANEELTPSQLTELDDRHSALWKELVEFEPANKELAELMVLMLLDKLQTMAAQGENCMIVREKLLELYSMSFSEPQHYVREVYSQGNGRALA